MHVIICILFAFYLKRLHLKHAKKICDYILFIFRTLARPCWTCQSMISVAVYIDALSE